MKNKYTLGNMIRYARRLYSLYLVRNLWVHWFNPLYTLYFNFIFFPLRQAVHFPVFIFGWPKLLSQYGRMECVGTCKTGMVRINLSIGGSPQNAVSNTELEIWGKVLFRGRCVIGSGNKIIVGYDAVLDMGEDTKIMNLCNLSAYAGIRLGAQSWIVHRCQVLDTNFHYIADFKHAIVKKQAHPIVIGDYCWICNSSTVTGGAIIPDKTIVASNSLVNKNMSDIPEESIIGGIPAKLVSTGYRRIESRKFEAEVVKFFYEHPEVDIYKMKEGISHSCCDAGWEGN